MALPADLQALAAAHRYRQQQLSLAAVRRIARLWAALDASDVRGSWDAGLGASALATVTAMQTEAARGAQDYVAAAVTAWGESPDLVGAVPERAFAGFASDGRTLDTLLAQPVGETTAFLAGGMPPGQALDVGGRHLGRIVGTQVTDAARVATGVAQVADRQVSGWIRQANPPSCPRCAALAGRFYRWSSGFARHPGCDCVMVPATKTVEGQSPRRVFDAMDDEQLKAAGWTRADVQAVRDGADIGQVVNAHRGMATAATIHGRVKTTVAGTSRRGLAGRRLGRQPRLVPESIYRIARDREHAIELLRQHGYIL